MKNILAVWSACLITASAAAVFAQEFANVEYLCADWGPAITLPTKPGEKPQVNDGEEVYFLKQVGRFTRKKLIVPDPFSGNKTEDIGHGISIYLCKMKTDGSDKIEIKELWHNPNYPIDTQAQSTWMDVNERTRKIALSVTFGGSDVTGLWTMNLDGDDLRHLITPALIDGHLQGIDSPSWTPDGQWIVFGESLRGAKLARIAKCNQEGKALAYLTDGPGDCQPRVSPNGAKIVYVHDPMTKLGNDGRGDRWVAATLWLEDLDGTNRHEIPNPEAKADWAAKGVSGTYPTWSPDGKKVYALSAGIIDIGTGKLLNDHRPTFQGKPWAAEYAHWGKLGLLGSATSFRITLTDSELTTVKALALSGIEQVHSRADKQSERE